MHLDIITDTISDVFAGADGQIISTVVRFTPHQAADYLIKHHYKGQRKLRRDHVLFLAKEMREGHFKPTATIAIAVTTSGQYLINGQHTLNAIIESNATLNLTVVRYIVETDQQVADLYSHYDIGRGRTPSDMFTAYDMPAQFPEWSMHTFNHFGYALNLIDRKFSARRKSQRHNRTRMLEMMHEWKDIGKKYVQIVGEYLPLLDRKLMSAPCFAIGLVTLKYQPVISEIFWEELRTGNAEPKSPSRVLRDSLMSTTLTSGFRKTSTAKVICQEEAIHMVAACWNAFYLGKQIVRPHTKALAEHFFLQGVPEKETQRQ